MDNAKINVTNDEDTSCSSSSDVSVEKLRRTIEIIQSSSVRTKEIYKGLTFIRTKVLDHPDGIKLVEEVNCFKCLFKILAHTNEDVLNVTISILGNLCNHFIMSEEFRDQVIKGRVAGRLVTILRKVNKVNLQKRICRCIGNLAQSDAISREFHLAGATYAIVHLLSEAEDLELQYLAIRALRWLWHIDKHHGDMLKAGVVMAVSSHISSNDFVVEKAALRALAKFTQQRASYIAEQIGGDSYKVIVQKLDQPIVAVLVSNLSYDPLARIELCKAGVVPAIITKLEEGRTNSYLISGLCRMCRESMIRASLRQMPNGFSTLLSLLSSEKMRHFYPELLEAINQFNYDRPSLIMMVRCGLINVLVEKLAEFNKAHCTGHSEAVSNDWLGSPLSPASPRSWASSPPTSPGSPPLLPTALHDYSPRHSISDSDDDAPDDEPPPTNERYEVVIGLDGGVLDVLSRLSYQGIPMRALGSKATITTLLDYLAGLPFPRFQSNFHKATRTLISIILCKHYWNNLLDEESVLEIHAKLCRPSHQECGECKRIVDTGRTVLRELGLTAQSGLGEGEITYRLTGASDTARLTTALTIPHVIREANLLETLLYSHGGLSVLLDGLSTRPEEAVPSLHSLFFTLDVNNPQQPIQICSGCEVGGVRKESNVLLMVDDGTTVSANREALSHSCPVFEAMFRGSFKESTQQNVRIPDISAACLSHLTKVLPEYCSCILPKELPVLLEMITATDRFLVPDLTEKVVRVMRDSALSPASAAQAYAWALRTGQQYPLTANLHTDVISYLFTADVLPSHRLQAVTAILATEDKDNFFCDISNIVRTALTLFTKNQRLFRNRFST